MSISLSSSITRLDALLTGPWADDAILTEAALRPPAEPSERTLARRTRLDLRRYSGKAIERTAYLETVLRFHWDEPVEEELFELRAAFDGFLDFLALEELAIATGYLALDEAWVDVRRRLNAILWSDAAQTYLENYGYVGVRLLAARVKVDLHLPQLRPPDPLPKGAIRFASMLSELRMWFDDGPIDDWLDILDDFTISAIDKYAFADRLAKGHAGVLELGFQRLVLGVDLFVTRLTNLFEMMPEGERPLYGIYFNYWLGKFFGVAFRAGAYQSLEDEPDWTSALIGSPVFSPQRRGELIGEIAILRRSFASTMQLVSTLSVPSEAIAPALASDAEPKLSKAPRQKTISTGFDTEAAPVENPIEISDGSDPVRRGWWQRTFGN